MKTQMILVGGTTYRVEINLCPYLPCTASHISDDNDLIQRLQVLSLKRQEVGPEVEEEMEVESEDRRWRSKSQDDYSYFPHGDQFQLSRNRECRHRCSHH